jgi:hypothetical protein
MKKPPKFTKLRQIYNAKILCIYLLAGLRKHLAYFASLQGIIVQIVKFAKAITG